MPASSGEEMGLSACARMGWGSETLIPKVEDGGRSKAVKVGISSKHHGRNILITFWQELQSMFLMFSICTCVGNR